MQLDGSRLVRCVGLLSVALAIPSIGWAQSDLDKGFKATLDAQATGEELTAQPDLWALETSFKPMRMIWVNAPDPKTGQERPELFWYLVYRTVNRELERREDTSDRLAVNAEDPVPVSTFVPEFTLVSTDGAVQEVYQDRILPAVQAAIVKRERQLLKNTVNVVAPIPAETPAGEQAENPVFGVAIWRGADARIDSFTVYASGFSNGYRFGDGPDGELLILRRTIALDFDRKGDEFDEREREFRLSSDPRWIYRPDDLDADDESDQPPAEPGT